MNFSCRLLAFLIFLCSTNVATAYNGPINSVTITTNNNYRYIKSNGIPITHGVFPNSGNPNSISEQDYYFRMPLYPKLSNSITKLQPYILFGVGLDGIPFDPGTAETYKGNRNWIYEALSGHINLGIDQNNAHVQPNGAYHYHGLPTELIKNKSRSTHSKLIGYAADGFPIYARYGNSNPKELNSTITELKPSYQLKSGYRPSGADNPGGIYDGTFSQDYEYVANSGDLDECNGRLEVNPDYPQGTYVYYITQEFPIIPRCFKGNVDKSFYKEMEHRAGPRDNHERPDDGHKPPPPRR